MKIIPRPPGQEVIMLKWDCEMELGVRSIDAQHKHIFDFLSLIENSAIDKRERIITSKMTIVLRELFQKHFIGEEDLMFHIHYPDANKHMVEHSMMLTTFDMVKLDFEQTSDPSGLLNFVCEWIVSHMKSHDFELVQFVKGLKEKRRSAARQTVPPQKPQSAARL